ncbi:MAG: hypothetical protein IKQ32_04085, partial [Prevotella sp.]|nr:hypothetical protein [Prevotella sp.]
TGKLTKDNINKRGYNKYLKLEGDVTVTIDMDRFEADAVWDGVKGHVTNTKLDEGCVLSSYSNLWFIKRAFYDKFIVMQSSHTHADAKLLIA